MAIFKYLDKVDEWVALYAQGYSFHSIATRFGVSYGCVNRHLHRRGVRIKGISESKTCCTDLSLGEMASFFSAIDREEKAYWLGIIVSDGNISSRSNKIILGMCDKEHVEKFASLFDRTITQVEGRDGWKTMYRCEFSSRKMKGDLDRIGVRPRKTLDPLLARVPDAVPDDLLRHFVRGVFDGDGSIFSHGPRWAMSIAGQNDLMESLNEIISSRVGIKRNKRSSFGNISTIRWGARKDIEAIAHYLYNDVTVWLERKRDKFVEGGFLEYREHPPLLTKERISTTIPEGGESNGDLPRMEEEAVG